MTFEKPEFDRFPGLRLAYDALRTGGGATTVYNAANEVAVAAFIGLVSAYIPAFQASRIPILSALRNTD